MQPQTRALHQGTQRAFMNPPSQLQQAQAELQELRTHLDKVLAVNQELNDAIEASDKSREAAVRSEEQAHLNALKLTSISHKYKDEQRKTTDLSRANLELRDEKNQLTNEVISLKNEVSRLRNEVTQVENTAPPSRAGPEAHTPITNGDKRELEEDVSASDAAQPKRNRRSSQVCSTTFDHGALY